MDNLDTIDRKAVQRLIAKYKVTPNDATYIILKDSRLLQIVLFLVFLCSLLCLFLFKGVRNSALVVIFCIVYFIYDFAKCRKRAKHRFKRELWLVKTLLESEDIQQFYKAGGASGSQEFFRKENIKNWSWDFDFTSHIRQSIAAFFIKRLSLHNKKIIELGCGGGQYLKMLISYNNMAYGIDLDMHCLRTIGENNGLYLCQADIGRIPFKDNCFDAALFLEVLEHLPFPQVALIEASRVLKSGGILFLTTHKLNCMPLNYFLNPLKFLIQILTVWFEGLLEPKPLINIWRGQYYFHTAFSRKEIKSFLSSNFRVKSWGSYGVGGGLIAILLKLSASIRKMFYQLNYMEQQNKIDENYLQLRKSLAVLEYRYGKWLGKINVFLQKLPLIRLIGTNHLIILQQSELGKMLIKDCPCKIKQ